MTSRFLPTLLVSTALCLTAASAGLAESADQPDKVHFNRDIRPIFSDTCFHCHGFDPKARKAGLRLDIREDALKKTDNDVYPIVPGKPDESEIVARVFTKDDDDLMPPPKAHKELTPHQKELIKRWVAEGAVYEPHWAYAPLTKLAVPAIENQKSKIGNPIDGFIREKLAEKKIEPSPEAPKAGLLRRLSLDLTGLPPTPDEVKAFVEDSSPDAYEKQVDRLLASLHYGERMAVWWLDVARFTDTVGFHGDQNQRIFPYRDYVINSFNKDKGFDQFTIEQLAGDLLPNPTTEQLVATGYNRLNMMTREGGAQPKEYLAKYGAERVRSVAAAWFGSTFGCAECHDHKFDPIKTRDFYELKSFFADVEQWGVYSDYGYTQNPELAGFTNDFPFPPEIEVESPYLRAQRNQAKADLEMHLISERGKVTNDPKVHADFEKWAGETQGILDLETSGWFAPALSAQVLEGGKPDPENEVTVDQHLALRLDKPLTKDENLRITLATGGMHVASVRIEVLEDGVKDEEITASFGKDLKLGVGVKPVQGKLRRLGTYYGDAMVKERRYENGAELSGVTGGWFLPRAKINRPISAVWSLDPPVTLAPDEKLVLTLTGGNPLPLHVSVSPLAAREPLGIDFPGLRAALAAAPETRTGAQQQLLADTWLLSTAGDRPAFDRYKELSTALRATNFGRAWTMVTKAAEPLTVRVLPRGNWQDESGPVVLPATPSFLPGRLESTPEKRLTRLDLAKWIVSKENPITARAVMNRLWQQFFGIGLSAQLDDLGSQGELPSHPELLDWIASEFRDSGWDFKHMIKLLVMSDTYRQSSVARPELREIDPTNRLLAFQNPRRLDAEFVRDNALFIAGKLNLDQIGGPSIFPYQPPGYYDALQFPTRDYVASTGAEQWRRGVYMHWQRTFLHPMLANFDAPPRDECAATRVVSNTPQQALTLLNDPTFVEAARLFAGRVLNSEAADDGARLDRAFQIADARTLKDTEKQSLQQFLDLQREYYRTNKEDAGKLLKIGNTLRPRQVIPRKWLRGRMFAVSSSIRRRRLPVTDMKPFDPQQHAQSVNRRTFLNQSAYGLGGLALAMLQNKLLAAPDPSQRPPSWHGALQQAQFPIKAKRVIFLCMAGGPSQFETLDWKPELKKLDGQPFPDSFTKGQQLAQLQGSALKARGPFTNFQKHGNAGIEISDLFPNIAGVADELCVIRSMQTEQINHDTAHAFMNTGSIIKGRPSMGSWLLYGLGAETQDLPGFIVLMSQGRTGLQPVSARQWSSGVLPSRFQGIQFQSRGDAVHYIGNPEGVCQSTQRQVIEEVERLNGILNEEVHDPEIATRIAQYELAFKMQSSVPELMDFKSEPQEMLDLYGVKHPGDGTFASNCLLARRLAERGVRMIQLYHRAWDHHGDLEKGMKWGAEDVDKATAALISDLRQRGMLDDTLILWGGEFGRTPMGQGTGRDHHILGFSVFMAGGGVKPGMTYGATDELGYRAVENPVSVHDLHATMLALMGIDHHLLSTKFQGLDVRLTNIAGNIVKPIMA